MSDFLGRISIFVNRFYFNATLFKSPYLEATRVKGYDDFSPEFDDVYARYKMARVKLSQVLADDVNRLDAEFATADVTRIKEAFFPQSATE